jgi:hypothetical protein
LNTIRKTACTGLLFLLLCTGPLFGEEPDPDGEPLFYEEYFLFGGLFPDGETFLSEEPLPDEEPAPGEEILLSEEPDPDEGTLLANGIANGIAAGPLPPEGDLFDDDDFFFEADPLVFEVPRFNFETRSFDNIFPGFSRRQKALIFSDEGLKHYFEKGGFPMLVPNPASGIDLLSSVMAKNPSHIIEAMVLVPYKNRRELDMLDVYNALGRIGNLKDYSFSINGRDINIFEETTRLVSARNRRSVSDPPPADTLPYAETMYLRFKDAYYGNLFIRGDVSVSLYGITYSMTNFTDVRYFLVPIIKAERISVVIYLEPVKEGVLVYSMSGIYLPGFIADKVNITPSVNRRINTLIKWITDGLRIQENI